MSSSLARPAWYYIYGVRCVAFCLCLQSWPFIGDQEPIAHVIGQFLGGLRQTTCFRCAMLSSALLVSVVAEKKAVKWVQLPKLNGSWKIKTFFANSIIWAWWKQRNPLVWSRKYLLLCTFLQQWLMRMDLCQYNRNHKKCICNVTMSPTVVIKKFHTYLYKSALTFDWLHKQWAVKCFNVELSFFSCLSVSVWPFYHAIS